jgi:hypothetical protein
MPESTAVFAVQERTSLIFRRWAGVSLLFLLIVAVLGAFLRSFFVFPTSGLNFKFWLHGHSHVAFLGWIFNALYVALVAAYVRSEKLRTYHRLFWTIQLTVLGMLVLFPLQGYAAGSIIVSTLHVLLSYFFAWRIVKDRSDATRKGGRQHFSFRIIRFAILLMLFSSLGPFALGPIMAQGLSTTHWYHLAIYFYLHFQYNGWFLFAIIGLFFYWLEHSNIHYQKSDGRAFFLLNAFAAIPAYASSVLWTQPPAWLYWLAGAAALSQLISLYFLFRILKRKPGFWKNHLGSKAALLFSLVLLSLITKNILQVAEAFPWVADLAYRQRNLVIAYLHLNFIGIITFFLLGWFEMQGWLHLKRKIHRAGQWLFVAGFVLSQLVLVVQALLNLSGHPGFPDYFSLLFYLSLSMPVGLVLLLCSQEFFRTKEYFSTSL